MKSWRELGIDANELPEGTRASMDGQVAESVTYEEKLRKMTPKQQDEALGVGKAQLFRDGMTLREMVQDGKELPLKDLGKAKKESAA